LEPILILSLTALQRRDGGGASADYQRIRK
jgi:hypothetical protein